MIVVSSAFALAAASDPNADLPIVGWESLVTTANIAASEAAATGYPVTNLANPATHAPWVSANTDDPQYVTVTLGAAEDFAYLGVARHNFGTGQITVSVEGQDSSGGSWAELVGEYLPADDAPLMFRFTTTALWGIRLKLQPGSTAPEAAVLMTGPLLVFERGCQAGHTPIPYGRSRDVVTGRSVSGEFLGRIITGGSLRSSVNIIKLSAAWYRSTLDPFFAAAGADPFFFAWAPDTYPEEVGYCWLTDDPVPVPSDLIGHIDVALSLEGLML